MRLISVAAAVAVAGCSAGERLKDLIKQGDYARASEVYNDNTDEFVEKRAKYAADLDTLAAMLKTRTEPVLRGGIGIMRDVEWPAGRTAWPDLRAKLGVVIGALDRYARHKILLDPRYLSPSYRRLTDAYEPVARRIRQSAPARFAAYDHLRHRRFFDVYPIRLPEASFLSRNFGRIGDRLEHGSTTQLARFLDLYPGGDKLKPNHFAALSNYYLGAAVRESSRGKRAGFATYLEALAKTRGAGFQPDRNSRFRVAFIEVAEPGAHGDRLDFAVRLAVDLPASVEPASANDALDRSRIDGVDYLVLVVVRSARASSRIMKSTASRSRYLTGYASQPNPNYENAQLDLQQARADFDFASTRPRGMPTLKTLEAQLAQAERAKDKKRIFRAKDRRRERRNLRYDLGRAKNKIDRSIERLRTLPRFVDVPVHQEYDFEWREIEAVKDLDLTYYVIDRKAGSFIRSSYAASRRIEFRIAAGVHDEDVRRDDVLSGSASTADIDKWRRETVEIKMSEITQSYLDNPRRAKRLSGLAAVRRDLSRNRPRGYETEGSRNR